MRSRRHSKPGDCESNHYSRIGVEREKSSAKGQPAMPAVTFSFGAFRFDRLIDHKGMWPVAFCLIGRLGPNYLCAIRRHLTPST